MEEVQELIADNNCGLVPIGRRVTEKTLFKYLNLFVVWDYETHITTINVDTSYGMKELAYTNFNELLRTTPYGFKIDDGYQYARFRQVGENKSTLDDLIDNPIFECYESGYHDQDEQ